MRKQGPDIFLFDLHILQLSLGEICVFAHDPVLRKGGIARDEEDCDHTNHIFGHNQIENTFFSPLRQPTAQRLCSEIFTIRLRIARTVVLDIRRSLGSFGVYMLSW